MKKILSTLILFFFVTAAHSATPLVEVSWLKENINNKKVKQVNSNGEVIEVTIGDKPYSSICDYQSNCDYKCNWEPNPRKNYPINNDTYNIRFAYNDIQKCKKIIKDLFKTNIVYDLSTIEHLLLKKLQIQE